MFVTYSRLVVDNPLSHVAPPTFVIDTFVWHTNSPKLMELWQKIILISSSIAICERGFSKRNAISNHLHNMLNLKTLDALMQTSLCGLEVDAMDWATIVSIERNMRDQRIRMLD